MEKAAKEGRKRLREGESELEEARNKVQLLETGMAWLKSKVTKTEKVVIDGILRSETLEELKGYTEINFGGDDLPVEYFCTDTPLPASIVKAVLSKKEPAKWLSEFKKCGVVASETILDYAGPSCFNLSPIEKLVVLKSGLVNLQTARVRISEDNYKILSVSKGVDTRVPFLQAMILSMDMDLAELLQLNKINIPDVPESYLVGSEQAWETKTFTAINVANLVRPDKQLGRDVLARMHFFSLKEANLLSGAGVSLPKEKGDSSHAP